MENKIYRSPLFYVGDKYKLIKDIKQYFPKNIDTFIEPFMGGGSVFLNINANSYLVNDIDKYVYHLHSFLMKQSKNPLKFLSKVEDIIDEYGLSKSFREDLIPNDLKRKWVKTYYAKYNKVGFEKLKSDFNTGKSKTYLHLYILLIYGFNRMLRFNSSSKYNLPVGNVDFNSNVINSLNDYFNIVINKDIKLHNMDYKKFLMSIKIKKKDFIYLDPPYLITFSEYNKLWNDIKERELLNLLDKINSKSIRFAISNVTHYKNNKNDLFLKWCKSNKYHIYPIKSNYISYHDNSIKTFKEVLVTNYATHS